MDGTTDASPRRETMTLEQLADRLYAAEQRLADLDRLVRWARGRGHFDEGRWPSSVPDVESQLASMARAGGFTFTART